MRGISFSLLLLMGVTGCTTTGGIRVERVEVPLVTVEKCIQKKDIPPKPSSLEEMPFSLEVATRLALAKVAEWRAYGNKVDPILKGCAS